MLRVRDTGRGRVMVRVSVRVIRVGSLNWVRAKVPPSRIVPWWGVE